jgi:hypothetical protein
MTKSSFISTLIDDHGILHVVSCIRDNCNNSISTVGVLPEIVLLITLSTDKRLLREENTINLIVHTVRVVVVRSSHSLLSHLALIHITR